MPITLPATDPASLTAYTRSNGRVIVVYNTDVSWSLTLASRYARKKRIPTANLVGIAMGTNATAWSPASNAALMTNFVTVIRDLQDSILAQYVLTAPGVPQTVLVRGITTGLADGYDAGTSGYTSLSQLAGICREIKTAETTYGANGLCLSAVSGNYVLPRYLTSPGGAHPGVAITFANATGCGAGYRTGLTGSAPSNTYDVPYTGLNSETVRLPSDAALAALGDATCRSLPTGRIGFEYTNRVYTYEGTYPDFADESFTRAFTYMEQGMRYAEACSAANRYRNRVHFQFNGTLASSAGKSLAYLYSQMDGWGYDVDYAWRQSADADMAPYAPYAGTAYTQAQLDAGQVKDRPYHLMVGDASNLEMFNPPYVDAWKPSGGGGSVMGPSEGWCYALRGLERGAASGLANVLHITATVYSDMYAYVHCLLRGLSWAEAGYFSSNIQYMVSPCGDPLARPFPL